ncbi:thiamin pyrophosphokinase [Gracilibacillus boraciitolerans JCM 21714]|uniref:Thiamine diphosphokinase n=1 Tax=Gracilibacillus boraciitolerans JCM 21714 TaxID=1298598 RepID=W4VEP8_9BACI|nr:thiamine diphosphokinase [Gracilibacillus boraciitolerans]GAE91677.1 thiamin pyrophosphokinase [Gracilibacillus boraciitolerans JCM 21714]
MNIGIVAGGPLLALADLSIYKDKVDLWIGADLGANYLLNYNIDIDIAIGDFDSVSDQIKNRIKHNSNIYKEYPSEKNETDLELAIVTALTYNPTSIMLFGVTAGRLDHELANIQLLYRLLEQNIEAVIMDYKNEVSLYKPGRYNISARKEELISFLAFSSEVQGLSLEGFYYPLHNEKINWGGSTRCISNFLIEQEGTFLFESGILIVIKSTEEDKLS